MTQNHEAYPNITKLTLGMIACNGGLFRERAPGVGPEADVKRLLDECLGAEGVYHDDLKALDDWLGTLTEDEFLTMVDGEHEEILILASKAPSMGDVNDAVVPFLESLFEHCI